METTYYYILVLGLVLMAILYLPIVKYIKRGNPFYRDYQGLIYIPAILLNILIVEYFQIHGAVIIVGVISTIFACYSGYRIGKQMGYDKAYAIFK